MPSLASLDARFAIRFEVIQGGSGFFEGIITEPNQGEAPSYLFTLPRRILRIGHNAPVGAGIVIRDPLGSVFMVGQHGAGEMADETLFRSFRLFEATGRFNWQKRGKTVDPVTQLERDSGLVDQPPVWGCFEPSQEGFDRQIRQNFEAGRFITATEVAEDDIVDDKRVTRVDRQLGLYLATLG